MSSRHIVLSVRQSIFVCLSGYLSVACLFKIAYNFPAIVDTNVKLEIYLLPGTCNMRVWFNQFQKSHVKVGDPFYTAHNYLGISDIDILLGVHS